MRGVLLSMSARSALEPVPQPRWRLSDIGFVALLSGFVATVACWGLAWPSLSLDEASTWAISGHGLDDLARSLVRSEGDAGALYLVIAHGWFRIWGNSETAMRSLPVLFAVATIPLFFALARRLLAHPAAVVATALLAVNPFFIEYSRDARMYSLALLLCVSASYWFVRLVDGGAARWSWLFYALTATAAVYAHAFAILVIAAHACSLVLLPRARIRWPVVARAFACTLLLDAPLFAYVVIRRGRGVDWIKPFAVQQIGYLAVHTTGSTLSIAVAFVALVGGAGALLVWKTFRGVGRARPLWAIGFALMWWLLPIAVTAAVSLYRPFFVSRYLLIALPGYVLTLGFIFERLRTRVTALAIATLIGVVAISYPAIDQIWGSGVAREDWRAAVAYVAGHYRADDYIVVPIVRIHPFGYYAAQQTRLAATRPLWSYPHGTWTVSYTPAMDSQWRTPSSFQVPSTGTFWIIVRQTSPDVAIKVPWHPNRLDWLRQDVRADLSRTSVRSFHGVVVYHYVRSQSDREVQEP